MKKQNDKDEHSFWPIILLIFIVAGIIFFLKGCNGVEIGGGEGIGLFNKELVDNNEQQNDNAVEQSTTESNTEDKLETETADNKDVTIKIVEDKVYVNDKLINNKDDLKKYLEDISGDDKNFSLVQENSILDTYNWTKEVLDELKIEYKETK